MKLYSCVLSILIAAHVCVAQQTVTIPAQSITVTIPAQTVPVTTATPVPPIQPPAAGILYGYQNGIMYWAGDFNNVAIANYQDTVGNTPGKDLSIRLTSAWGEWIPYMSSTFSFSTAGYTKLTLQLKPTVANQKWTLYFVGVGDVSLPANCSQDVLVWGPAPVIGKWGTYTIPLSALCVLGKNVYKFALQDKTGLAVNTWYVNNAGFAP